jgi:hypothetical protein
MTMQNLTIKIGQAPANVKDAGIVRLGGESPSFGPVRKDANRDREPLAIVPASRGVYT